MTEPVIAQKSPYEVKVEAGRNYLWCACGLSAKQPFCDGTHSKTDHLPIILKAEKSETVWLCGCKNSKNKPYCDGTHSSL